MESECQIKEEFSDMKQISSVISILNDQRLSAKLCDVVLRISGDELYAHSNVLAAASPYFDHLFSGPDLPRSFSQKTPQIIEIHIDGEKDNGYGIAVHRVVEFMYTARITLEEILLPQIMEIASIMQMSSILGFCEAFQKEAKQKRTDEVSAGDKSEESQVAKQSYAENEIFKVLKDESDVAEGLTFKKNLKEKPTIMYVEASATRKRGRPRKTSKEQLAVSDKQDSFKDNVEKNLDEKENTVDCKEDIDEGQNGDQIKQENDVKPKLKKIIYRPVKPVQRVSRSGRVIKPKLFSDDILSSIKKEVVFEPVSKKEFFDALKLDKNIIIEKDGDDDCHDDDDDDDGDVVDDDVSDPSFSAPKIIRQENDENIAVHVKKYACEKCDVVVSRLKDFHEHNREHMHAEKKCSYCGWVCENGVEEFEEHLNNHRGPKPFFCNFCNVRFKTRGQLFLHLPKHSKAKPFVCGVCDTGFKWKHALKNHMITHQDTKDYLCDICGFATAHKNQLKSHRLIHTGECFKCPEEGCSYMATKKTNLKFHLLTHTREKPHQCEICGTSFSLVKNMKRHMLLHKTDRPFKCEKCTFSTTRFDKLKEHYFKQHNIGEKPGKKFTWAEYRQQEEKGFDILENAIKTEENVLGLEENMETIELEVASDELGTNTTQILNLTSSNGENIPITITQIGADISYEIPVHLIIPPGGIPDQ